MRKNRDRIKKTQSISLLSPPQTKQSKTKRTDAALPDAEETGLGLQQLPVRRQEGVREGGLDAWRGLRAAPSLGRGPAPHEERLEVLREPLGDGGPAVAVEDSGVEREGGRGGRDLFYYYYIIFCWSSMRERVEKRKRKKRSRTLD